MAVQCALPKGLCGVPCVRDVRVPVEGLSASEVEFWVTLTSLGWHRHMGFCMQLCFLDGMVQSGSVARRRAAAMCNVMKTFDESVSSVSVCGLLYHVLQHQVFDKCLERCLEKVPVWGICPHVVRCRFSEVAGVGVWEVATAMAAALPAWSTRDLLQYGAFPWFKWIFRRGSPPLFDCTHDDFIVASDSNFFRRYGLTLPVLRLQWRRWHARLRKRWWVMLAMSLM